MAISKCISLSAENRIEKNVSNTEFHVNETGFHGTPDFPVAVYLDDVTHEYVNWHWHEEFEIGFVTEGSIILGSGSRQYKLNCGDVFFVNSNVLHSMRRDTGTGPAVFKSIAFHSSLISDSTNSIFYTKYLLPVLLDGNLRECVILPADALYREMLSSISTAWDLVYSESPDYELLVRNELSTLFCLLNKKQQRLMESAPSKVSAYLPEKRVQLLLDHLHAHYRDRITIEGLAKAASISKTEVLRCFKVIMGQSPINYLNEFRLHQAAYLLVNTEKRIREIAEDCGFDDNSYFSKLFKRKYHVTPHDYRFRS